MLFTDGTLILVGICAMTSVFVYSSFLTPLNVQLTIENLKATVFRFVLAQTRKIILTLYRDFFSFV